MLLGPAAVVVLTVATGFFVAQEFGFVAADRALLRGAARNGDRGAGRALRVMERLSLVLSGAQFGITVTALVVGFIAEPAIGHAASGPLAALGVSASLRHGIAVALGFVLATGVQMVLGELAPKNWSMTSPERVARALAAPTLVYLRIAGPLVRLFDATANRVLRLVGIEPAEELRGGATPEELELIIDEAARQGRLPGRLSELLGRALEFSGRTTGQVMLPRTEVVTVGADESMRCVVELLADTGHSRYPVLSPEHVDDIVGVVGVQELLAIGPAGREHVTAGQAARHAVLVPDSLPLPGLLRQLRERRDEFACVLDEYGALAGIVTVEDIAEELVGEIGDENDLPEAVPVRQPDGSWLVPGFSRLDEVERATGVALPPGPYETVSGLVMARLGRMPTVGDAFTVTGRRSGGHADTRVEVVELGRRVPVRVRLVSPPPSRPRRRDGANGERR